MCVDSTHRPDPSRPCAILRAHPCVVKWTGWGRPPMDRFPMNPSSLRNKSALACSLPQPTTARVQKERKRQTAEESDWKRRVNRGKWWGRRREADRRRMHFTFPWHFIPNCLFGRSHLLFFVFYAVCAWVRGGSVGGSG